MLYDSSTSWLCRVRTLFPPVVQILHGLFTVALVAVMMPEARGIDRLPIETFSREPEISRAKLSPDGKYLAYLRSVDGRTMIFVDSLDEPKRSSIDPGLAAFANDAPKEIESFSWVSNRRLLFTTMVWDSLYGVLATNIDGSQTIAISGYETIAPGSLHGPATFIRDVLARCFEPEPTLLMVERHEYNPGDTRHPDVMKVNTMREGSISVAAKNPGEVVAWEVDDQGEVRAGFTSHGKLSGMVYRDKEGEAWRDALPMKTRAASLRGLGYDSAAGQFLVAALDEGGHWAPFHVDAVAQELGEPLLSDPEYDIVPPRIALEVDGIPLSSPVYGPKGKGLLGYRYFTEAARVKWFDKQFEDYQRKIDHTLPNTVNIPVEISQDGKRILWFAFSDQDPGTYLLADLDKHALKPIGKRMSWIKPAQMASMLSVKYLARDGITIHGYLTVPAGHVPKDLPLILFPHGGPWARDIWKFDPLVQLLANRGYAVLQVNYRGSVGYGQELYTKAQREIGGKIQDDIEDAARWAIGAGVADPKRIAIMGGSYGGYSSLFGLGMSADLYRCGISFAGVTDWLDIFERRQRDSDYKQANGYWREQIGDPEKDAEKLRAVSPVNFAAKITAPVLIIQGKEDRIVPPQQANLMISALEKSGHKPESLFLSKVGHSYGNEKTRLAIFKRIIDFLAENLGPGVQ